jgi:inosine-uridine nucleoside N-ribohydrolase
MRPVIFDTDIGTDVDDILALVLLAKAPELQLLGVTTVYGDTLLRAKVAQVTCNLLQRKEIAVIPGERHTLSGRQIFWVGQEGYGVPGVDKVEISESIGAVQYLIENAERYAGDLEILATGPLTNIASAISQNAKAFSQIKHLYLMGGAFWMDRYEHNVRCDTDAARMEKTSRKSRRPEVNSAAYWRIRSCGGGISGKSLTIIRMIHWRRWPCYVRIFSCLRPGVSKSPTKEEGKASLVW